MATETCTIFLIMVYHIVILYFQLGKWFSLQTPCLWYGISLRLDVISIYVQDMQMTITFHYQAMYAPVVYFFL